MSRPSKSNNREAAISVARDFSPHPGPRYVRQGPHSGEAFRKRLVQLLRRFDRVLVDLDGTSGYGSSFLDEAFGGLVSKEGFTADQVRRRVELKSDEDETYVEEVCEAIALATPQKAVAA
jgi:hypothetical protein